MVIRLLAKTLYSITDLLVRRDYHDKMMASYLGLKPQKVSAALVFKT